MQNIIGVFEGGGVKGIALAGAAAATLDHGYRFERIVGTSAGALVGSLVMSGYTSDQLRSAVCAIDWADLLDPFPETRLPLIGKHIAIVTRRGLYRGDRLEAVWTDLLATKGVTAFTDLGGVFRVVTTDLTHTRGLVFPDVLDEYGHNPDTFPLARAVRMSASVPFAFAPVPFENLRTGDRSLLADGAMAANFPIQVVDPEAGLPAVGFRFIDQPGTHPHRAIGGPLDLAAAVMWSGVGAREGLPALQSPLVDIIRIPSSRSGLDFDLTPRQAGVLFEEGYAAAADELEQRPLVPQVP